MWSDVVVLAVWLSVVEARGTLWPLWALGPHFSFNIYPCLPAPSRRKRPPLTENSITLGLYTTTQLHRAHRFELLLSGRPRSSLRRSANTRW